MSRLETWRGDAAVLRRLLRGMPKGGSHAAALTAFYGPQSSDYDRFRERLLAGRAELIASLRLPVRAHVVELGGGTGRNAEFFGARLEGLAHYDVVDLCKPLLERARLRTLEHQCMRVFEADACSFQPAQAVDAVILSYALTMIPDWRGALANALAMLKPGGQLAVVDFYVSAPSRRVERGGVAHGIVTRHFWPAWFRHDGVRLDDAHLRTLRAALPDNSVDELSAAVPYLPFAKVPYYRFIGRTAGVDSTEW